MYANASVVNEQAVLGTVMYKPQLIDTIAEILPSGDYFHHQPFGWAWDAILALHSRGEGVDAITVGDELERVGRLTQFSTADNKLFARVALDYISEVGEPASAVSYAVNIADYRNKRIIGELMNTGATWAANGRRSVDIINDLTLRLGEISAPNANSRTVELSAALSESVTQTEAAMRGEITAVKTGLTDIDRALGGGLYSPDLIIVAGRPGTGKTSMMTTIARKAAKNGKNVMFFSLEMSNAQIATRLTVMESGLPFAKLRSGNMSDDEVDAWRDGIARVSEYADRIRVNDKPAITEREMRMEVRKAGNVDLIICDYLQLAGVDNRNGDRYLDVGAIARGLKTLSKEFDVPVIAGAQLNRNVDARANKKPVLSDLRESGDIENTADIVIMLHKEQDDFETKSYAIIAKHRNGAVGEIEIAFLAQKMQFADVYKVRLQN